MIKRSRCQLPRNAMRGFTLMEILVSLVVVAIGLIAVARLQSNALFASTDAYHSSIASFFAYEMAERMRVNPQGNAGYSSAMITAPVTSLDCVSNTCSASNIAAFDIQQWITAIAASLPEGAGRLIYTAGTPDAYTVIVRWKPKIGGNCDSSGGAGTTHSCFTLNVVTP